MAAKAQGVAPATAFAPAELPPGFRFHPTDEELINFYLKRKILLQVHDFIPQVDLYNFEPWDLADKSFWPSRDDDPRADRPKVECYLFGPRGRKYANGLRMNRATPAGFWKSTGKDQPVMHHHMDAVIGMKKTLVYHLGRAPNGVRTDWVMHEYRLHNDDMTAIHDTYALCRVFKKKAMAPSPDVPGGANADKDGMKAVAPSPDVPGGADADKDKMQSIPDGAHADKDGMKAMEVDMDNSWMMSIEPVGAEADMDYSWMMPLGPVSAEAGMDDSWSWMMPFVTEQQEPVGEAVQLAAQLGAPVRRRVEHPEYKEGAVPDPEPVVFVTVGAGPSGLGQEGGEAAHVVDDGAAGRGAEGGGQEEDEE